MHISVSIFSWPFKISEAEATVVGKTTVPATTSRAPSAARRTVFRSRPPPDAMSTARIAGAKQTPAPRWVAAADAVAPVASRGNYCTNQKSPDLFREIFDFRVFMRYISAMAKVYYDYLIIGNGIAGVTAAETIRSRDAIGSIAVLSGEPHPLYSRVLLPAYLKGRIGRERIFLRTADDYAAKNIDFYPDTQVRAADAARREIKTTDNRIFSFGKLLVATGGRVKSWKYDEAASARSYRLQTIDDADRLLADLPHIRQPLVVGSSFIALEFIEIFLQHKIVPRVLAEAPGFFSAFLDEEGSKILEENFKRHGVSCMFGEKITGCRGNGTDHEITTAGAGVLCTDAFAIGIGIERNRDFLADSSITLGTRGVRVNEYLEADAPGVWAAGDSAEYYDSVSGEYRTAGNWTHAVLQGTRAGLNMAGDRAAFTHIPSYAITNCGMQIAAIGECGGTLSIITRRGGAEGEYARLSLHEGAIVGAFLINRFPDRAALTDLISRRVDVRAFAHQLRDMAFDIHAIARIT